MGKGGFELWETHRPSPPLYRRQSHAGHRVHPWISNVSAPRPGSLLVLVGSCRSASTTPLVPPSPSADYPGRLSRAGTTLVAASDALFSVAVAAARPRSAPMARRRLIQRRKVCFGGWSIHLFAMRFHASLPLSFLHYVGDLESIAAFLFASCVLPATEFAPGFA